MFVKPIGVVQHTYVVRGHGLDKKSTTQARGGLTAVVISTCDRISSLIVPKTAQEWRQNGLRAQTLLDNLSKMLNSNEQFEMDDSFNLSVVHVRPPPRGTGKKRQYVPGHQWNVRLKQMKKSVIEMPRDAAGWCAARAIVTARGLSLAGQDANACKQWIDPRQCVHRRQQSAEALAQEVGLGPGAWGPDELTRVVMAPSLIDYKLVVVDASRAYSLVAYGHGDRLLALLYDDHRYDTLTSIKGFLGPFYLCLVCLRGYDHQGQHRCPRNKGEHCSSCLQTDCDEHKAAYRAYRSPDVLCPQCQRHFNGTACLERHRTRTIDGRPQDQDHRPVCQTRRKCPQCRAYLRGSKAIKDHRCGHAQCHACQQYLDIESHQCFIQVRTLDDYEDDDVQPPVHVFFDIEPNKSIADTCLTSWSASAPTTTSSIGGTVTRASKSFCSNWRTGVKAVNNR